jgi:hypothetical protein
MTQLWMYKVHILTSMPPPRERAVLLCSCGVYGGGSGYARVLGFFRFIMNGAKHRRSHMPEMASSIPAGGRSAADWSIGCVPLISMLGPCHVVDDGDNSEFVYYKSPLKT